MNRGSLYLIPNVIAEGTAESVIPSSVREALKPIRFFLVEDVRTARRYLSTLKIYDRIDDLVFDVLNKDTAPVALDTLMKPLMDGQHMGVISESGCPGVADPGALAVAWAHRMNIRVVPLTGPSSLLMALMASGLNGQRFAFHGYLPIDKAEAAQTLKALVRESRQRQQTQIFIETPYRNNAVFAILLNELPAEAKLTVALDLTGKQESIVTHTIAEWKSRKQDWPKLPAVFLFLA